MLTLNMILGILGGQELLFILIIVLVLFGGRKIPELMRGLGRGVGEYNKAKNEIWDQVDEKNQTSDQNHKETSATEKKDS